MPKKLLQIEKKVIPAVLTNTALNAYYPIFHPWLPTLFFSLHLAQCNFGIRPTIYRVYRNTSL